MAIDYRRINAETKKQANYLPLIADIVDKVSGKTYYSNFDMQSGFMQILMKEEDIPKTAFAVNADVYEFIRMPFGLTGAPFAFQSVMNRIKSEVKAAIYCYLDDVVVVSESEETHLKDIAEFLQVMEMNGLKTSLG
uniref:Reverse transcriptase domain-containing protein n=1 Tax=Panagrolaimus superbus TaxID=310955 RepID=A0A914Z6Z5_9BILA